jgi:hypothetical protein
MSLRISMVHFDVPYVPKRPRGAGPFFISAELYMGALQLWEVEDQTACGQSYSYGAPVHGLCSGLDAMPHLDRVFRFLAGEYARHRGTPLGDFVAPAVEAMEAVIAERDGSSVYFAECDGLVKIGWSKKVATRLAQLQTGNPTPIRLLATTPGGLTVERRTHERFAAARLSGEWFELTSELREHIESLVV